MDWTELLRRAFDFEQSPYPSILTHEMAAMLARRFKLRMKPGHVSQIDMSGPLGSRNGSPMLKERTAHLEGAGLLRRTFALDVLASVGCGGRGRVLAGRDSTQRDALHSGAPGPAHAACQAGPGQGTSLAWNELDTWLCHWDGEGAVHRWHVSRLLFAQYTHEVLATRSFLVWTDSAVYPQEPGESWGLPRTRPQKPYTDIAIVRKRDLMDAARDVDARVIRVPLEGAHIIPTASCPWSRYLRRENPQRSSGWTWTTTRGSPRLFAKR